MVDKGFRKILICVIVVVLLAGLCTAVSVHNYVKGLNRVTVASSVGKSFAVDHGGQGSVFFAKIEELKVPENVTVEQWLVSAGDNFEAGAPLGMVCLADAQEMLYETLTQIDSLEDTYTNTDNKKALLTIKIGKLQEKVNELQVLIDTDGILYAPADGQVTAIAETLSYGVRSEGWRVEWLVSPENYRAYTDFSVTIRQQEYTLDAADVRYDNGSNQYVFSAVIPADVSLDVLHGEYAQVKMHCVTQHYSAVIPKRAVFTDSDGFTYVYTVRERKSALGTEAYLDKVGITIQDSYQYDVAVLAELENFIVSCSHPPVDLEAVMLLEDTL